MRRGDHPVNGDRHPADDARPPIHRVIHPREDDGKAHGLAVLLAAVLDRAGVNRITITANDLHHAEQGRLSVAHDFLTQTVTITRAD
jgi:hypothetical protein